MKAKKPNKFEPLIGFATYIDRTNGYLIIDSKAHVVPTFHNVDPYIVGTFVGMQKSKLLVQYGLGRLCAYSKKYTKII